VKIVPGVEFGIDVEGAEVHMLGYFFDVEHPALLGKLAELREGRLHRGKRMVEKLVEIGVPITWERVQEIAAGGSVGRPHVGRALVEAGFVETLDEAFEKYLGNGKPAYVPRSQMTLTECIALIHEAGGVASMAHPTWVEDVEGLLIALVETGLDGIETYYGQYGPETVEWLAGLAEKYDLVPTGGSDFHGLGSPSHAEIGSVSVPPECFAELERRATLRKR
jgi:predicted metal-dependent phosphoesterase TrpH